MNNLREKMEDAICNGLDQERAWALREDYSKMRDWINDLDNSDLLDHLETALGGAGSCDHSFQYQGTVAWSSEHHCPGSGAYYRHYAERYYCTRCLEFRHAEFRQIGNTYQPVLFNAIIIDKDPRT